MCTAFLITSVPHQSGIYWLIDWLIDWLLCWVFVSVRGLCPVAASGGHSSSRCADLSPSRPLLLRSTGSRRAGSVAVAHGPSCSAACGILPDQGSNPCPLHWQADSQPLRHQGSPRVVFLLQLINLHWHIIVTRSPVNTLRLTLGVVHSVHLDKCMMTCIHHYCIIVFSLP